MKRSLDPGPPTTYALSISPGLGAHPELFLLLYVVIIVISPWPVKVIFIGLLLANAFALFLGRSREQVVTLDDALTLQIGYGPPLRIRFEDIAEVTEYTPRLSLPSRLYATLIRARYPGYEPFAYSVQVRLLKRKLRWAFLPFPFPGFSKRLILPVVDGSEFVNDVKRRLLELKTERES
jgi:hypothetical protein